MTIKQRIGQSIVERFGVNRQSVRHIRFEVNAAVARLSNRLLPADRRVIRDLRQRDQLKLNVGCGPFGLPGWVNLDLFPHTGVTLVTDCRRRLPVKTASCAGIHVEHFLEHLHPVDERQSFLKDCRRALTPNGILRIVVPDAERYVRAYLASGWNAFEAIGCGGEEPKKLFSTKMMALSHVFLQEGEHFGGFDAETLQWCLREAGFETIQRCEWRQGQFPGGCIDREQHRPYSLYMEATA